MNEKDLFEVRDKQSLERMLEKRIHNIASLNVYYKQMSEYWASGKTWYIELIEKGERLHGEIIKNNNSKIFISGTKKVIVYVSEYQNPDIIVKELDYIHNHYFFAMGTKRNTILASDCIVMIFIDDEGLHEGKNYGNSNTILAYDEGFEDKKCIDFVISKEATAEHVADAFEKYINANGGSFKELLWERHIGDKIKEFVFVVEHESSGKLELTRTILGTNISGEVIELAYGDELRIYIGQARADYVMRTYGESILDCQREILKMQLSNNNYKEESIKYVLLFMFFLSKIHSKFTKLSYNKKGKKVPGPNLPI